MPSQPPSAPAAREPRQPRQPWLHELVVAVDGNATCLSDRAGALGAPGTGLLVDDRRVLSVLDVRLGEEATSPVLARASGATAQLWGSARHLGNPGPDPTVEVARTRRVRRGGMTETVVVRSRASAPVETTLEVALGGDGAPLHDIKAGTADDPPLLPALAPVGRVGVSDGVVCSWADERHVTTVAVSGQVASGVLPSSVRLGDEGTPTRLSLPLRVAPGGSAEVVLDVDTTRLAASAFDADAASDRADWASARVVADDPRLGALVAASLDDLRHLLMDDPQGRGDVFAGAGSPWYLTLFGRDSLWAARLALPFSLDLAAGTLAVLARRQGVRHDPATAEAPGKILHEVRREAYTGDGLALPPVYYGTVDATALWVCLLHDAWRHGLAPDAVRRHGAALVAAMGWLQDAASASPDGLLRYVDESGTGLANQGWKDSGDSMRRADGTIAPAPIALVEAQAYAVEAGRGAAALGRALGIGDPQAWQRWEAFAVGLAERVRGTYWAGNGDDAYLAMAVDGDGRLVDGVGSNMGHVLGTGTLRPDEAARVAATLTGPAMLGPHGISTLSRANPAYNPIGYHTGSVWTHDTAICALGLAREGLTGPAGTVVRALVEAGAALDHRWPELFSGDPVLGTPAPYPASCRPQAWSAASAAALVTALLGLRVDVPARRVALAPTAAFGALRVEGLRYGSTLFTVDVDREGVARVGGLPDDVTVEVRPAAQG